MDKPHVIIYGPQGSGKTRLAQDIKDYLGDYPIEEYQNLEDVFDDHRKGSVIPIIVLLMIAMSLGFVIGNVLVG